MRTITAVSALFVLVLAACSATAESATAEFDDPVQVRPRVFVTDAAVFVTPLDDRVELPPPGERIEPPTFEISPNTELPFPENWCARFDDPGFRRIADEDHHTDAFLRLPVPSPLACPAATD